MLSFMESSSRCLFVSLVHVHTCDSALTEKEISVQSSGGQLEFTTFTAEVYVGEHKQAMASLINNVGRSRSPSARPHVTF